MHQILEKYIKLLDNILNQYFYISYSNNTLFNLLFMVAFLVSHQFMILLALNSHDFNNNSEWRLNLLPKYTIVLSFKVFLLLNQASEHVHNKFLIVLNQHSKQADYCQENPIPLVLRNLRSANRLYLEHMNQFFNILRV